MAKKILNKEMQSRLVWNDFARFTPEEGKQYILFIRLLRTNTCMYFIDRACRYHLDNEEFKNIKGSPCPCIGKSSR